MDGELLDDNTDFNNLTKDERVNRIIQISKKYMDVMMELSVVLIFVLLKDEANELSKNLMKKDWKSNLTLMPISVRR